MCHSWKNEPVRGPWFEIHSVYLSWSDCMFQFQELLRSTSPAASFMTTPSWLHGNRPVRLTAPVMASADETNATNSNTEKQTMTARWELQDRHAGKKSTTSESHTPPSQVRGQRSHHSTFTSASVVLCVYCQSAYVFILNSLVIK